ncbi:MAG: tRNA uridine 5-carboxymethylaminomethyl modification enzyme, partial [Flavobacteriaceae bacterium]
RPGTLQADSVAESTGMSFKIEKRVSELLKMPEIGLEGLLSIVCPELVVEKTVVEQVEIQGKYAGYLDRQQLEIDKTLTQQEMALPDTLDYSNVTGLSNEVLQKLSEIRPGTIGQASRISGMTPAAISLLLVHLKKRSIRERKRA